MSNLDKIYKYLLSDNIILYEEEIFKIIPELKYEKGFDQMNEWHCYDVWNHTIAAIKACDKNKDDRLILLLHDIGKPFSYQLDGNTKHFNNHALKSSEIAKNILSRLDVPKESVVTMLKIITEHATKIDIDLIDKENINYYKRLLKIQLCDASGYEQEHSKKIIKELILTKKRIVNK